MRWKKIEGFPKYFVSDCGQVKTTNMRPGILSPGMDRGYLKVSLYQDGKGHPRRVHRLVAEAFVSCPDGMDEVNHKDCNKLNNHFTNLEWTNRLGNMQHCDANNLRVFRSGEEHGGTKLTAADVIKMRELYQSGLTSYPKLSREYRVSISSAQRIVKKQTWKYL